VLLAPQYNLVLGIVVLGCTLYGMKYIVGVDEVGRGPVAGPVTVCVFIMQANVDILQYFKNNKLKDSKKLSEKERVRIREELIALQKEGRVDFCLVSKTAGEIDALGISKAVSLSIEQGLEILAQKYNLDKGSCKIELDGALKLSNEFLEKIKNTHNQKFEYEVHIKGDEHIPAIACASILAKVDRDKYMVQLAETLKNSEGKDYGWSSNVGYGTKVHIETIKKQGITKYHRKSFLKKIL
jgi:ribonuclease HII